MSNSFVLKGHVCHTPEPGRLVVRENACVVCEAGVCRGVFDAPPPEYRALEVVDCGDRLILPGLVDLHLHASQFAYRGTGMDCELLDWLSENAFPEEARFADAEYAKGAYGLFADRLRRSATTRAVIFATIHVGATLALMERMEQSGLVSYVGKVSMDRNAPEDLRERSAERAAEDARRFVEAALGRGWRRTKPILTPRFVPSCTDALMAALGRLRAEYGLPVQSHLSENVEEIAWVAELASDAAFYGDAYDRFGLFGGEGRAVMAHCVHSDPREVERMLKNGVWVAHCPASNMNLASGIAPVRRYLERGLRVGLGTDVAGGASISMFRAVTDAIQMSKLYWRYIDREARPLTFPEGLYLATKGGGGFFGAVGSFEAGCAFDALVLDDSIEPLTRPLPAARRLERAFYLGLDRGGIVMKFADGERVL